MWPGISGESPYPELPRRDPPVRELLTGGWSTGAYIVDDVHTNMPRLIPDVHWKDDDGEDLEQSRVARTPIVMLHNVSRTARPTFPMSGGRGCLNGYIYLCVLSQTLPI